MKPQDGDETRKEKFSDNAVWSGLSKLGAQEGEGIQPDMGTWGREGLPGGNDSQVNTASKQKLGK